MQKQDFTSHWVYEGHWVHEGHQEYNVFVESNAVVKVFATRKRGFEHVEGVSHSRSRNPSRGSAQGCRTRNQVRRINLRRTNAVYSMGSSFGPPPTLGPCARNPGAGTETDKCMRRIQPTRTPTTTPCEFLFGFVFSATSCLCVCVCVCVFVCVCVNICCRKGSQMDAT